MKRYRTTSEKGLESLNNMLMNVCNKVKFNKKSMLLAIIISVFITFSFIYYEYINLNAYMNIEIIDNYGLEYHLLYDNLSGDYPFSGNILDVEHSDASEEFQNIHLTLPKKQIHKIRVDILADAEAKEVFISEMKIYDYFGSYTFSVDDLNEIINQNHTIDAANKKEVIKLKLTEGYNSFETLDYTNWISYELELTKPIFTGVLIFTVCLILFFNLFCFLCNYNDENKEKSNKFILGINVLYGLIFCFSINTFMMIIEQGDIIVGLKFIFMKPGLFFSSYIMLLIIFLLLLSIKNLVISSALIGLSCFFIEIVNIYKLQYRGQPIFPWDIMSIRETASIVNSLNLKLSFLNVQIFILICLAILIASMFPKLPKSRGKNDLIKGAVFFCSILIFSFFYISNNYIYSDEHPNTWDQSAYYRENGLVNSFLLNFKYLLMEEPENYSKQSIDQLVGILENNNTKETKIKQVRPNIIVIMSEGFWNAEELPNITFDEELLPEINELKEKAVYGEILTPKYGGGTSNVEFEVLSGFSDRYMPVSAVPYQQYVIHDFYSVVSYFKSMGYNTTAIHPYSPKNYNRETAYANLQFYEFLSEEDFINPNIKRGYISDMELSNRIIDEYEKNKVNSDSAWFNFAVTMQNHVGYDGSNFDEQEKVKFTENVLSEDVSNQLSDFATGLHYSDEALGYLIDYFDKIEDPTLIIFFGDHKTNLGSSEKQIYYETGFINDDMTEKEVDFVLYKTPFIAWSNYDDINMDLGSISAYQLLPTVFDCYNIDKPKYFDFLDMLRKTSTGCIRDIALDKNGNVVDEMSEEQETWYSYLELLQYDYIFGNQYSKDSIFNFK